MIMKTLAEWTTLARNVTRNVTPENIDRIAWLCFEADRAGGKPAVWHASAVIHGTRCACSDCCGAQS